MPTDHAILAPSAASRWLNCTPSARLEAQMPSEDTSYSREGTLAHSAAEIMLRYYLDEKMDKVLDIEEIKQLPWNVIPEMVDVMDGCQKKGLDFWEMLENVHEGYVRIVYEDYLTAKQEDPDALLLVEQKLKLTEYVPEGFGSSDSVLIWKKTCKVNDLKYGKGIKVSATENKQMMNYGLGALLGPCELYDIETVIMTILQPRLHHVSSFEMSTADLVLWAKTELKPKAELAFKGEGAYVPGDHCHFCKAAPVCKALKAKAELTATQYEQPEVLTTEQLAQALAEVESVKAWAKRLEDYALKLALDGTRIPGYKLVEGRSRRTIKDQKAAIDKLAAAGFSEADVCKPKELKTITELEKLLRKAAFNDLLGEYVIKPQGKPALVPESDPRPEFKSADEDFKNVQL